MLLLHQWLTQQHTKHVSPCGHRAHLVTVLQCTLTVCLSLPGILNSSVVVTWSANLWLERIWVLVRLAHQQTKSPEEHLGR